MPSVSGPTVRFTPLHPKFAARVDNWDFSEPMSDDVFEQLKAGIIKYGVLFFPKTKLDNNSHIEFSRRFGDLDDVRPNIAVGRPTRFPDHLEIFDVSNLDEDDHIITNMSDGQLGSMKGNELWHADLAFNPRRAGYSLLRAEQLPPPGYGGETEFLDCRTAYADLPEATKERLENLVCHNSLFENRKKSCS